MADIYLRVLGPLRIEVDGRLIPAGSPKTRAVLALLVLSIGELVSTERIVDTVWADTPPATARAQVQAHISQLRRMLGARTAAGPQSPLISQPSGYGIALKRVRTDVGRFDELVQQGRELLRQGAAGPAADRLRAAQALWRGPAYADVAVAAVRYAAEVLNGQRLDAVEATAQADLALGDHEAVARELGPLVVQHPLRERLRGLWMIALARTGRVSDAIAGYERGCQLLREELGAAPTDELSHTYHEILAGAPGFRPAACIVSPVRGRAVPRWLPAPLEDLTGRDDLVDRLSRQLAGGAANGPVKVALTGLAGVGKTAVAVALAHSVHTRFPDGQIFVKLVDDRGAPRPTPDLLACVLDALGVPEQVQPREADSRAAMLRDVLTGRRVLLVLDHVAAENQLQLLLPAERRCAVLATSQCRLTGVDGLHRVPVGVLPSSAGADLLRRVAGADRVDADPQAARSLVRLCGGLPLALRVVGARLATRTNLSCAHLVDHLAHGHDGLTWLAVGDLDVRESLCRCADRVSDAARRLLGGLAELDLPEFPGWACAALLDVSPGSAERLLDDLVESHLVEPAGVGVGGARYRMHRLLRLSIAGPDSCEPHPGMMRVLDGLRYLAASAAETRPHRLPSDSEPAPRWLPPAELQAAARAPLTEWFAQERPVILAVVKYAVSHGLAAPASSLVQRLPTYFDGVNTSDGWAGALSVGP